MKTNTCPRGKKKLDCITSLDIDLQYLKKKKSKKKSTFVSSKMLFHTFSPFRYTQLQKKPISYFFGQL